MFHAITGSLKDKKMAMMYQAVNHRCRHLVIREDTAPFGKFKICGQDQTLTLIAVGYDPEQQLGTLFVYRNIAPLIQNKQVKTAQIYPRLQAFTPAAIAI